MIREILKELRVVVLHLEKSGYFDENGETAPRIPPVVVAIDPKPNKGPLVAAGARGPRPGYDRKLQARGPKLTKDDAVDIFNEDRMTYKELADIYNVTESTIAQIKNGFTWWKATGAPRKIRNSRKPKSS